MGYLITRRTVAGGLSGAFILLLGLGLWYGWRSATYLWALQWTIYAAGILLLWAWLALEAPLELTTERFQPGAAITVLSLIGWFLMEARGRKSLYRVLPSILPTMKDIGSLLTQGWAVIFVLVSVVLTIVGFLLVRSWSPSSPRAYAS